LGFANQVVQLNLPLTEDDFETILINLDHHHNRHFAVDLIDHLGYFGCDFRAELVELSDASIEPVADVSDFIADIFRRVLAFEESDVYAIVFDESDLS